MALITVAKVQEVSGLSPTDFAETGITDAQVTEKIYDSEAEIQAFCKTGFLENDSDAGLLSVVSATTTSLVFAADTFTANQYDDWYIYIKSGLGAGQWNQIIDTTTTTLSLEQTFAIEPDNTSKVFIVYSPAVNDPGSDYLPFQDITVDGSGTRSYLFPKYPMQELFGLTISDTEVTPSSLYHYKNEGRIELSNDSEETYFRNNTPQLVNVKYWMGVYRTPRTVKTGIAVLAAIKTLIQQIGGTYDDLSTFSFPEASGSVGQAYVNIEQALKRLSTEWADLKPKLPVYRAFA